VTRWNRFRLALAEYLAEPANRCFVDDVFGRPVSPSFRRGAELLLRLAARVCPPEEKK
jgi:hypothetical protein